ITSAIKVVGDFSEFTVFDSVGTTVQIEYRKILYIEVMKRKILVHTQDNIISSREKISELEERLDHPDFYRIHRLFMVNMKYVINYDRHSIYMGDGSILPISEKKIVEFRKVFTQWKFERGNG
ncbi:MAG: LytTR family transcriptional regulator, partial [Clostridiales bacterium]|nr:LytTR family transcriptional regulator [Clostridiales bacterium]